MLCVICVGIDCVGLGTCISSSCDVPIVICVEDNPDMPEDAAETKPTAEILGVISIELYETRLGVEVTEVIGWNDLGVVEVSDDGISLSPGDMPFTEDGIELD